MKNNYELYCGQAGSILRKMEEAGEDMPELLDPLGLYDDGGIAYGCIIDYIQYRLVVDTELSYWEYVDALWNGLYSNSLITPDDLYVEDHRVAEAAIHQAIKEWNSFHSEITYAEHIQEMMGC